MGAEIFLEKKSAISSRMRRSALRRRLFLRKDVTELVEGARNDESMKRSLGAIDLVLLGVGGIIGTGIFVLTGTVAANNAGPAIVLSFIIAGFASGLAGLCYAELSSMIPIAGSAYTYSYVTLGELVAWVIGWDLILEYLVGAATVASGWSGYFGSFLLSAFNVTLSKKWTSAPIVWDHKAEEFVSTGAIADLPAAFISLFATAVLVVGISESTRVNNVMVVAKVAVVLLFIFATMTKVDTDNWTPFIPENTGDYGRFGVSGVLQGATIVFFAYIGFDSVSTTAQECKNPQRDLPIGILGSLSICTVLYIVVSMIATGLVPYQMYEGVSHPISFAVEQLGEDYRWLAFLISFAAVLGLTSVLLMTLMGQPRIFYAMAKDGLLPEVFATIHPRFRTPYVPTIISGVICALCSALLPIEILSELTSIGTLFAFVLVSLGVMILRRQSPDLPRLFRVPGGDYLVPLLGALSSLLLMCTASMATLLRFLLWMAMGLCVYAAYGYRRSHEAQRPGASSSSSSPRSSPTSRGKRTLLVDEAGEGKEVGITKSSSSSSATSSGSSSPSRRHQQQILLSPGRNVEML